MAKSKKRFTMLRCKESGVHIVWDSLKSMAVDELDDRAFAKATVDELNALERSSSGKGWAL